MEELPIEYPLIHVVEDTPVPRRHLGDDSQRGGIRNSKECTRTYLFIATVILCDFTTYVRASNCAVGGGEHPSWVDERPAAEDKAGVGAVEAHLRCRSSARSRSSAGGGS